MPTLLRVGPYQFFIVMFDCGERMHVHVQGGGRGAAKFWLVPEVSLAAHRGYTARDLVRIEAITQAHRADATRALVGSMRRRSMMQRTIITSVRVDAEHITFALSDGRVVAAPTAWSPRLLEASADERADYRIDDAGVIVEWPAIDEHIGLWTLLGVPEDVVLEAAQFNVKRDTLAS